MNNSLPNPCYVVDEKRLRDNLATIADVASRAGVEIILAFKAFAWWKTFPIFRKYISGAAASSPYEARLAHEKLGVFAHTYSPAYENDTFRTIFDCSSHISFNSLTQYAHFGPQVDSRNCSSKRAVSIGLRVNPEYSEIDTSIYNPCAPGSRFGVVAADLPETLPTNIDGFHIHNHCESTAEAFQRSWQHVEQRFSHWLPSLRWINFGGGHLMTAKNYNIPLLVETLSHIRAVYPNLHVILEPGSAFAWQTGELIGRVVDIVCNDGIKTAVLNVSFTCHMPDCLEMPYQPTVENAETLPLDLSEADKRKPRVYRLGGNSCLSGDWMGYWQFEEPLAVGDTITFCDMIHYTTVKANMFNGIAHPALAIRHIDGQTEVFRQFEYSDYLNRMC